jgi:predicted CxxxxCH...CXXCH cytochrome family protein
MTTKMRSLRIFRNPIGCLILLAAFSAAAGCSTAQSPGGGSDVIVNHISAAVDRDVWTNSSGGSGHASNATWNFVANSGGSSCTECHGSDLLGGISRVSCMSESTSCHHGTKGSDWVGNPGNTTSFHGASAKKAPGNSGFAACQICHGKDFRTPRGASNRTCYSCHTLTPHASQWRTGDTYVHTTTDAGNAPVCALCHLNGANSPIAPPSPPAPAGAAPGCYNNTLCHAAGVPHALGAIWTAPTSSQFHGLAAKQDLSYCQGCHGTPGTTQFNGGAAPTSCQASCHTEAKAHPIRWYQAPQPFPGYVSSHRDSGNQSVACAICHKVDGPGTGPDPNAPSCFSASFNGVSCHSGGPGAANHPVPFQGTTHTQANQASYNADCANCHSITGVPPNSSAPTCVTCHQSATTLPFTNCTSCHARPPAGATYPNVAGRHAKHDALASVTGVCSTCHNGLDTGSLAHYNRANARPGKNALRVPPGDAAFLATYNAKAGAASFDNVALTCANVSCHGAVTAPNWQTGTIIVNTDAGCRACHKLGAALGNPENNSEYSGLHSVHLSTAVGGAILCTECHNMANGTTGDLNHFKFLNTPQMEGPASQTVEPNGLAANYNTTNQTCGNFTCHTVTHSGFPWGGGANHPVPPARFTGTSHTSVTSLTFPGTCGACHFETGAGTKLGPTCTVCHQAGSPLSALNCTSCHGGVPTKGPNGPTATAPYPNKAGAHAKHWDLGPLGNAINCDTCHSGLGSGTTAHYDSANARTGTLRVEPGDVAFISPFPYTTGTATENPTTLTCGSVSCHGAQTTPGWRTTGTTCTTCHKHSGTSVNGAPANYYNDYTETYIPHDFHLGQTGGSCDTCHGMTVATHFGSFGDKAIASRAAAGTILPSFNYPTSPPPGGADMGNCTTGCH